MMEPGHTVGVAGRAGGLRYPVDHLNSADSRDLLETAANHYSQLLAEHKPTEFFSLPGGDKIKIDGSSVLYITLYREDDRGKMLVLINPQKRDTVLAVYLNGIWWPVDDILKSSDPSRDGLIQVQTFGERIVLFVLNCLVLGFLENSATEDGVCFLPHPAEEQARILWHSGEAAAFYTYKNKGSLCNRSSQCYLLPILDTMFVRRTWRRRGFGTKMLQDYCRRFAKEVILGISCPISPAMYQVCHKFFLHRPEEQDRLWEVEAPGDWCQRVNIWLRIQLGEAPEDPKLNRRRRRRSQSELVEESVAKQMKTS